MNRVILIGNGFDLAHGMETSYKNFLDNYINEVSNKIDKEASTVQNNIVFEDKIIAVSKRPLDEPSNFKYGYDGIRMLSIELTPLKTYSIHCKNKFVHSILRDKEEKSWVDIEEEYYKALCDILNEKNEEAQKDRIKDLNKSFSFIKEKLHEYLKTQKATQPIEDIYNNIYSPINFDDLTIEPSNALLKEIEEVLLSPKTDEQSRNALDKYFEQRRGCFQSEDTPYGFFIKRGEFRTTYKDSDTNSDILDKKEFLSNHLLDDLRVPKDILFLNFNYTGTECLYIRERLSVNHIHGAIESEDNPIIFGYGDEYDDNYKAIEKLKNNDFLENIKSINYLNTSNYRNLISYIDSDYYQIFIMGHSCGLSDKTLLKTLFEHKNCACIKPYFHEKEKSDDYSNLVMNISRCFDDKPLMRERVVNRIQCQPLVDKKE